MRGSPYCDTKVYNSLFNLTSFVNDPYHIWKCTEGISTTDNTDHLQNNLLLAIQIANTIGLWIPTVFGRPVFGSFILFPFIKQCSAQNLRILESFLMLNRSNFYSNHRYSRQVWSKRVRLSNGSDFDWWSENQTKILGIWMVPLITWSDYLKTGQKSFGKVKCSDFCCRVFRWLL